LDIVITAAKIKLIFLPAYSPELNPIELVFAQVKRNLRENRIPWMPLYIDICNSFAKVSNANIIAYYKKCIETNIV